MYTPDALGVHKRVGVRDQAAAETKRAARAFRSFQAFLWFRASTRSTSFRRPGPLATRYVTPIGLGFDSVHPVHGCCVFVFLCYVLLQLLF